MMQMKIIGPIVCLSYELCLYHCNVKEFLNRLIEIYSGYMKQVNEVPNFPFLKTISLPCQRSLLYKTHVDTFHLIG